MKIQTKVSISQMHETQMKMKYLNDALNTNRLALVTGAYSDGQQTNICWEIAKKLKADNGIKILSCDRKNIAYPVNLLDARERKQWLHHSLAQNPDILILGHADMALKWFEDYSESEIDYLLDESLISHLKIVREFINATIDKPYKKYIVFISSMAYDNVLNGSIPYMVAKAGIATAVKGLAWELASKNYNVIGIHPSNTHDTPMTEQTIQEIVKFRGVSYEDAAAYWGATCPKGRFLTKTELANFVSFFISGTCDYLSGANIEFKGGQR